MESRNLSAVIGWGGLAVLVLLAGFIMLRAIRPDIPHQAQVVHRDDGTPMLEMVPCYYSLQDTTMGRRIQEIVNQYVGEYVRSKNLDTLEEIELENELEYSMSSLAAEMSNGRIRMVGGRQRFFVEEQVDGYSRIGLYADGDFGQCWMKSYYHEPISKFLRAMF